MVKLISLQIPFDEMFALFMICLSKFGKEDAKPITENKGYKIWFHEQSLEKKSGKALLPLYSSSKICHKTVFILSLNTKQVLHVTILLCYYVINQEVCM